MSVLNVLIKGATGWIGHQTAIQLVDRFRENLDLTLMNSSPVSIYVYNKYIQTITPLSLVLDKHIDYFFDYAFQTREKIHYAPPLSHQISKSPFASARHALNCAMARPLTHPRRSE
jgi:hypothetical protein